MPVIQENTKHITVPEKSAPAAVAMEVSEWATMMEEAIMISRTYPYTSVDIRYAIQVIMSREDNLSIQEGATEVIRRQVKVYSVDGREMTKEQISALELHELAKLAGAQGVVTERDKDTLVQNVVERGVVVRMKEQQVPVPTLAFRVIKSGVPFAFFDLRDSDSMTVSTQHKNRKQVESLLTQVDEFLKNGSIYKGTAINGSIDDPNSEELYYDPFSTIKSEEVVLSQENLENIKGLILNPMEFPTWELSKRTFLWAGDYGTGKTITTALVAQFALQQNYTVIRAKASDNLDDAFTLARRLEPSLVLIEDAEVLSSSTKSEVSDLLEQFDGLTAKSRKVFTILTTNDYTQITKGMTRPGRIDGMFFFEYWDRESVKEFYSVRRGNPATMHLLGHTLDEDFEEKVRFIPKDDLDYDAIADATEGFTPAFHGEVDRRAKSFCLGRKNTMPESQDYVRAARSLKRQFGIFSDQSADIKEDTLGEVFTEIVSSGVKKHFEMQN